MHLLFGLRTMSKRQSLELMLSQAKEKEKKYDWLSAVEFYEKAAIYVLKRKNPLEAGKIGETSGYCFYRAAFQAKTQEEFSKRMQLSVEAYKNAAEHFEKAHNQTRADSCKALATRGNYWVAPDHIEKKELLDSCIELLEKVAEYHEEVRDRVEYGKACNELLACLIDRFEIERDWSNRRKILTKGLGYGEKAITNLRELSDDPELTRFYYLTGLLYFWTAHYGKLDERDKQSQRSLTYLERALELSRKVGDPYLIATSNLAVINNLFWMKGDLKLSLKRAEKALQQGLKIKDNLLIGQAFDWLASITYWIPWTEEDPEKKRKMYEKVLKYANQAASHIEIISSYASLSETRWPYIESLALMAGEVETNSSEKRLLLHRAIKTGRKAAETADQFGPPESIAFNTKSLSKALYFLSSITTKTSERTNLLKEALEHAGKTIEIAEKAFPFWYWYRGVGHNYQASIIAELAKTETDDNRKRELLEKAVMNMERCVEFCTEWTEYYPQTELFAVLGGYYDWFGAILSQLQELTGEPKNFLKMIEVYQRAVEALTRADLPSRVAESYWKIAKVKDKLGEYLEAAENFESASRRYKAAAEKISYLKEFYMDYALYMQAWSQIEKARYYHVKQGYSQAKKHYEKAASLHESAKSWKYLAKNYLAWAQLEEGEELSRAEQSEEARQAFRKAAELFLGAKRTLRVELERIKNADEKDLAERLIKASDIREEYCLGRIILEEARILDRCGDNTASSRKYGLAAEKFQQATDTAEHESDRQDLKPVVSLCRAWQMMTRAEAEALSDLYLEASQLFDEAKEHSFNEKAKVLALGHSHFCKALEAGARFEATRDTTLYSAANQHLTTAANYYVKAGFKTASEYAKATQHLFDAYAYMDNAKKETDPEKKARYYMMAEKVLETSAGSYLKAKHPEKTEQVQRLLEKINEERELAASLSEILHAPSIASSTESFVTLTPSEESAVGLERFEHANVQASLILRAKKIRLGEDLNLDVELVNTGKAPASLIKIQEIIPEGFEIIEVPETYRVEERHLNMKGRRLSPLKVEEVRMILRPLTKGTFPLKPKIIYVNETGLQMFHEPEPIAIDVIEVLLPGRVTTGFKDLDNMLFGGIPENYSVILTSPSSDERNLLIRSFLEAGAKKGEVTLHVTTDASDVRILAENLQSNFYLFICNPKADEIIKTLPNVFKLKGVENLTDISIAMSKAYRRLDASKIGPRRACIDIVSDVLLQHQAVETRRLLTELIQGLRSRGFTTLAVMNPKMHPSEEAHAILDLFEGEINICERESQKGSQKYLRIKKMHNQRYLESELLLTKARKTEELKAPSKQGQ
jgi:KaiC/GvpD/RAD55 family RecA-like ATPase/tetratricopeptide (TPR) repeat protein